MSRSKDLRDLVTPFLLGAALLAGLVPVAACGGHQYASAGLGAAADADVNIQVEDVDGTKMVKVDLKHLPRPERAASGATAYVVWLIAEDRPPHYAGRLQFNEGDRAGKLTANAPYDSFTVLVTAEETEGATTPSKNIVAKQEGVE